MTTATAVRTLSGPQVLRAKQLKALLAAPDKRTRRGRRDSALLAVLGCGGLRLGECCRLLVENVEMSGDTPQSPRQRGLAPSRVRLTTRTAKSRGLRFRTITLPGPAARLLRDHLSHSEPRLFVFEGRRHEALSTRQAGRIVKGYLRQIGCGWAHPHTLRHSYATILIHQSHDIWLTQKQLGHASVTTTNIYAHADPSDADRAATAIEEAMR